MLNPDRSTIENQEEDKPQEENGIYAFVRMVIDAVRKFFEFILKIFSVAA